MERTRTKKSCTKTSGAFLDKSEALSRFSHAPVLFGGAVVSQYLKIGSFELRFYGIALVCAIAAAYFIGSARAKKQGISQALFDDAAFWIVITGFIAARIYYVIFYFSQYKNNLSEIYKIWHGGLGIFGAIIGGITALIIFCKRKGLDFWKFLDVIVFAMPIAQAIGRIGNFFNYEAFGVPTNAPWKMFVPAQFRPAGYENYAYFSPTFLYEMIWSVIVFVALIIISKKAAKKQWPTGVLAGAYFILYSVGRFFIEGIRLDSAYFFGIQGLRGDQITALLLILVGLGIIVSRCKTTYVPQNRE